MPTEILPARIALSELILHEVGIPTMNSITKLVFEDCKHGTESPYQRWYRDMSSLSATENSPGGENTRQMIAWKTGKPFSPRYLFFRTIDCYQPTMQVSASSFTRIKYTGNIWMAVENVSGGSIRHWREWQDAL